jgi:hypothetical protein
LIAPIEIPATQSGCMLDSASASQTPPQLHTQRQLSFCNYVVRSKLENYCSLFDEFGPFMRLILIVLACSVRCEKAG